MRKRSPCKTSSARCGKLSRPTLCKIVCLATNNEWWSLLMALFDHWYMFRSSVSDACISVPTQGLATPSTPPFPVIVRMETTKSTSNVNYVLLNIRHILLTPCSNHDVDNVLHFELITACGLLAMVIHDIKDALFWCHSRPSGLCIYHIVIFQVIVRILSLPHIPTFMENCYSR